MLKKSRNTKLAPSPTPPTVEEMLKDIETFHVDIETTPRKQQSSGTGDGHTQSWWSQFEQFVEDLKDLTVMNSEINGYKLKLESCKVEMETETQLMKNSIQEQRQQIDELIATESG